MELEERLRFPVDVFTPADVPAKFRERVLHEALPLVSLARVTALMLAEVQNR